MVILQTLLHTIGNIKTMRCCAISPNCVLPCKYMFIMILTVSGERPLSYSFLKSTLCFILSEAFEQSKRHAYTLDPLFL